MSIEFDDFLGWALPRLDLEWDGYKGVLGQMRKRLGRRTTELEIRSTEDYRAYLILIAIR